MLNPGTRVGAYEVVASIGAGGMGEVYRARDTRLKRDVALKVLPAAFASDPDRLARFQREAELLATLNHPHIAAIYGIEQSDNGTALVLELVEGETLADRIARGPIPLDEALPIARQIADALEAAHEQGVIHRDLKPANIKVTPDGVVKVLDFGLAKLHTTESVTASSSASLSPTITSPAMMTGVGMILGTAAYMSPEQAKGRPADKRSDVWAFGAVLYEMLTGTRAFSGSDVADTLASVLKSDPDWRRLPRHLPPALTRLMRRALEKDPKRRLQAIGDARLDLEDAAGPSDAIAAPSPRRTAALVFAAVLGSAALAVALTYWVARPGPQPVRRLSIMFPVDAPLVGSANDPGIAVSPDGSRLAYVSAGDKPGLAVRALDQLVPTLIFDGEDAHSPFFSTDGQWVAFFADRDGTLKKVSVAGGPASTIAVAPSPHLGASWGSDGTVVFAGPVLSRVSESGGTPQVITTLDPARKETRHGFPDVLPNNTGVLFTVTTGYATHIEVLRFDTGERHLVVENAAVARYVGTGHIVYSQAGRLFAMPFDQDALRATGPSGAVLDGVSATGDGPGVFAVSREGSLVYMPGSASGYEGRSLTWVDRTGRETPLTSRRRAYTIPRVSPDGSRVALELFDEGNVDIWIHDIARNAQTRLTFSPQIERSPLWTPDGRRVVFSTGDTLQMKSADGLGDSTTLAKGLANATPYAWSKDGKELVFTAGQPADIFILAVGGSSAPRPLVNTPAAEVRPAISPDGRWIAYQSNESNTGEVYVHPFPNVGGGRWQMSTDGGQSPVWAPNGRELFYTDGNTLMSVAIDTTRGFAASAPRVLFEKPYAFALGGRAWDIAPDGRLLVLKESTDEGASASVSLVVVQHWFEELKRLVP